MLIESSVNNSWMDWVDGYILISISAGWKFGGQEPTEQDLGQFGVSIGQLGAVEPSKK